MAKKQNTDFLNRHHLVPEYSILKVLVYFDMFDYPLTKEEIIFFLDRRVNQVELDESLAALINSGRIRMLDNFYSLQNDYSLVLRRKKGNEKAAVLMKKAAGISKLLYAFPYVRAVCVSGSVSKKFADENADIDYFVITKANRLWLARTFMHLFKKNPFLQGRNHWYCMNYYVDEAELMIEEKNIYTATELITLVPMNGNGSMKKFFEANSWAMNYFPNYAHNSADRAAEPSRLWLKKIFEFIFNNRIGDWLDDYFMRLTTRRWKLKEEQGRLNTKGEAMGLKTGKHCSKPNPVFFHDQFIKKYDQRMQEMKTEWNL